MAIDISKLNSKTENEGTTESGRLTANDWNTLVNAVAENQVAVAGTIKGITYNGNNYTKVVNGMLEMNVVDTTGRNTKFEYITVPNSNIAKGSECIVQFYVVDQVQSDNDASVLVPYENPGTVTFYVDGKQVGRVNGVYSKGYKDSEPIKFDFAKATNLSTKADGNTLKVEYTNNGVVIERIFNVNVIDLNITANVKTIYTSEDKPKFVVTVRGAQCKLYVQVDDTYVVGKNNVSTEDLYYDIVASNNPKTILTEDIENNVSTAFTHGIHTVKIWATPSDENYDNVSTKVLSYRYIYGDAQNSTPIIVPTIVDNAEFNEYDKLVVNYNAYLTGANSTNKVVISIQDADNNVLLSTSQSIEFNNGFASGSYTFTLFADNIVGSDRKLVIGIEDANHIVHEHSINIIINKSTTRLTQAPGCHAYFSAMGRSNAEENPRKWESVSENDSNIKTTVTFDDNIEFISTGSGWIDDKKDGTGNMAMHLKKGRYFTLNYKPFIENPFEYKPLYSDDQSTETSSKNGLTISFEFATRNCLNANATIIECLNNGIGFYATASETQLIANNISLKAKYKEDTRIRIDLVIEGGTTNYVYDTVVGTDSNPANNIRQGDSDECLAIIFVDGVYAGLTLVKSDTVFKQDNPVDIRFGSADCDLDIYSIRIYERALNIKEIVDNYAYDTPNLIEKIEIAQRNDIFPDNSTNNRPNIDIGKLKAARPELPLFYVTQQPDSDNKVVIPQDKSTWKFLTLTSFQNPLADNHIENNITYPAGPAIAKSSFEANTGVWRNQGTSSMTYPWPWRNWDWKSGDSEFGDKSTFKFYFPDMQASADNIGSKWHQYNYTGTGNNLAIKKITLKKDYASSEMCNNAICSEIFTDMAVGISKAYPNAVSPAMREELSRGNTDLRLSMKAIPSFMFNNLPDPNAEGTAGAGIDCLGMMNIIPNKNEVGYLGFKNNKWEADEEENITAREQSWELGDNLDDVFWVKSLNYLDAYWDKTTGTFKNDIKDIYEARTPKDSSVNWGDGSEADFGMTPKDRTTITGNNATNIVDSIVDEQKDIIDFHNWLVDTNRYIPNAYKNGVMDYNNQTRQYYFVEVEKESDRVKKPDYRALSAYDYNANLWNDNGQGGHIYEVDSPEYRLAKFQAEANDRLLVDQWILYYIWREQFWMFDSGFKNLQVYTVGPNKDNPSSNILQWGCMVRDADTALGIENTGRDYFPPHIEDIDFYTESNSVITFNYGGAAGLYDITELKTAYGDTAKAVLNGQFGSVWVNIRDSYQDKIASMYRALLNNYDKTHFGAEATINKFRKHQEHWCESLYNFGMRQYFGGEPFSYFNTSGLGDKKNSRAQWLDRGFYYRRGKYRALSDGSAFRINNYNSPDTFDKTLDIKAYIPMYLGCGGTTSDMINSKNIIRLIPDSNGVVSKKISIGEDGFNFPNAGDAVSYIYGTSMLTDIGDLARVCKLLRVQTLSFPKLRKFTIGHESERDDIIYKENAPIYLTWGKATDAQKNATKDKFPVNPDTGVEWTDDDLYLTPDGDKVIESQTGGEQEFKNEILPKLDCSSMTQLLLLDVTNHTNLSELNIAKCDQLQELYARGTILRSIELPKTTSLHTIYLGDKLTTLKLENLTGIRTFVINSLNDCNVLEIVNCGDYMGKESVNIMRKALNKLTSSVQRSCKLHGIKWQYDVETRVDYSITVAELQKLYEINADLKGVIQVTGVLSSDLKVNLVNKYGNIDSESNSLYITYDKELITSVSMPSKLYIYNQGDTQLTFTINPSNANTFKTATWSISNNDYATINESTGVLYRNDKVATELTDPATVTVRIEQLSNDENKKILTATTKVYFYEREAKVGDIVFNDGSYSDELDPTKTPIGVCFYVDPNDKTKRLMCALQNLPTSSWGVRRGGKATNGNTEYWIASPEYLNFEGKYDTSNLSTCVDKWCYDIQKIDNIETSDNFNGLGPTQTPSYYSKDSWFCDEIFRTNTGGFNLHTSNYSNSKFSQIGWKKAKYDISIDIDNILIKANETNIPIGYYNTLAIIEHRNRLLNAYKKGNEFNIPRETISDENEKITEMSSLNNYILTANNWLYAERDTLLDGVSGTFGSLMYYPAASRCYAYEPDLTSSNNELAPKFRKHNWFLPATGEMLRILYYYYQSYDGNNNKIYINENRNSTHTNANAFANAIKLGILSTNNMTNNFGETYRYCTSTENNYNNIYGTYYADYIDFVYPVTGNVFNATINAINGSSISNNKSSTYYVRPICMF